MDGEYLSLLDFLLLTARSEWAPERIPALIGNTHPGQVPSWARSHTWERAACL